MTELRAVSVLLIEDSPDDSMLIRAILERNDRIAFRIEHVERLADGVDRLDEGGIDVVLLDFSLPDSTGIATFRTVHESHPEIAVIVLTSLQDDELAVRAVGEGAQDYLVKREVDGRLLTRSIRYSIERQKAEAALRDSEERYALAVCGANDGLWDWDVRVDQMYLSPRWKAMFGFQGHELGKGECGWLARIHPDDLEEVRTALAAHFADDTTHFRLEHRMLDQQGEVRWVLTRGAVVRDAGGSVTRMAGSQTDVSARKQAEQQLLHDAFHDGLTGLANRALFADRVGVALAASQRGNGRHFAVLVLDLDRFKNINESLGHAVGDKLVVGLARRLEALVRPGDTVARLSGDEFAILVNEVRDVAAAVHVTERIQEVLAEPFDIDGNEVFVTASIGIVLSSGTETDPEAMLRDADTAMHRAKASGRATYEVFNREMHRAVVQLLKLETDLRRAVERGDFVMHYQPIVALDSGRIVGFEALVRWSHSERGLVAPTNFIGIAEETGLIVPLGWWVLRQACDQASVWQKRFPCTPPLFMSVNVSGKLFASADAVDQVVRVLETAQLGPESLRLEVTENVVMDHGERAMTKLLELRAIGVQLSIDDFGTGYSSLSYLQRFRYDSLKIDRSFVSSMGAPGDSQTIVETILSLADSLGIGVVAEGVETAEQASRLRQMRCPLGQGFWFARPLNAPAAEELLLEGTSW